MKGGIYTKTIAKIWVERKTHIRDIRGNGLPQIYRALYGDAMLELIRMSSNMADGIKPTETSVTEFCYKNVNLLLEELLNIKVILFLIFELFR